MLDDVWSIYLSSFVYIVVC